MARKRPSSPRSRVITNLGNAADLLIHSTSNKIELDNLKKGDYTLHMKIRIRYFASLREITGQNEELLMVDERASVADIRALLVTRYPRLQPVLERSLCAVNRG